MLYNNGLKGEQNYIWTKQKKFWIWVYNVDEYDNDDDVEKVYSMKNQIPKPTNEKEYKSKETSDLMMMMIGNGNWWSE